MLFSEILKNREKIRFHTPGHSRPDARLLDCDVTELQYSDNLLSPQGAIKDLENFLASAYRAEAAFLSTQGATLNIFQAVYARKNCGNFLIIGNAHRSVYNAMRLFSCTAYHADNLIFPLKSDIKTVIITCPDYFGNVVDLPEIYKTLSASGIALIVDAAHGAHFAFSSKLPDSASEFADLAILSLHKTLPVITGGSVLVCKKEYVERCLFCRSLLHTTSPNYMTMCSIENAVTEFAENGEKIYDGIYDKICDFKQKINAPFRVEDAADFSRLAISSPYDGEEVKRQLFLRGFVCETAYEDKTVFIVTRDNVKNLDILARCINELPEMKNYAEIPLPFARHDEPFFLSFGGEWELIELEKAEGRRFFGEAGFYPPGTPLLYTGDVLNSEKINFLKDRSDRVFGLENMRARVLK